MYRCFPMLAIWKSLCEEDGRDAEQTFYNAYKAEEIAKRFKIMSER